LADLKDYRVRASREEIARSLEGAWREDVLFELQQVVDRCDFCQRQIRECDQRLERLLAALPSHPEAVKPGPEKAEEGKPNSSSKEKKVRRRAAMGRAA
jgi:hypothetical protein